MTYCHSSTEDLPTIVHSADIVVAAVGRAHFVRGEWIKPEAVVRDAGYNEVNCERRGLLQGRFGANLITSVPGGVGPTTIAILIEQTISAAEEAQSAAAANGSHLGFP